MQQQENDPSLTGYLAAPMHVVEDSLFVFQLPLTLQERDDKQNSFVIVFSIWSFLVGTAICSLPWAFQQAGLALGVAISFTSCVISFYTSMLVVKSTGSDPEFSITLKKYYGMLGYYMGIGSQLLTMLGTLTVLFIILSELTYPILLAIYSWITNVSSEDLNI